MDQALKVRIETGRKAILSQVDYLSKNFGKVQSNWKPDNSRVTKVDHAISDNLKAFIHELYPLDHYCSEESQDADEPIAMENRFAWVVDPVDGTNNYATGIASCAISVGLFEEGQPVYGFLYDLSRNTLSEGGPGVGLIENGKKIKALQAEPLGNRSIIGVHFPMSAKHIELLHPLIEHQRLRSIGSGALNILHAATGRTDGVIDFKVRIWDIAAGLAFAKASKRKFEFLDFNPLPLTEFSVNMPMTPYFCGTDSFCDEIRKLLKL